MLIDLARKALESAELPTEGMAGRYVIRQEKNLIDKVGWVGMPLGELGFDTW